MMPTNSRGAPMPREVARRVPVAAAAMMPDAKPRPSRKRAMSTGPNAG